MKYNDVFDNFLDGLKNKKEKFDIVGFFDSIPIDKKNKFLRKLEKIVKDNDDKKYQIITDSLDRLSNSFETLSKSVKNNEISIKNFDEAPKELIIKNIDKLIKSFDEVRVTNLNEIPKETIIFPPNKKIKLSGKPKVDLSDYTKPSTPIAVRLSDGKMFEELSEKLIQRVSVGGGGGGEILPKDISHGIITTTSGTAIPLSASEVLCRTVSLQSHPDNKGYIYIGSASVTPEDYGAVLQQGEAKDIEIDDVSRIYISGDYNNEKVSWLKVR